MKYYAGIGSRETPAEVIEKMEKIASLLEKRGWILRSGGAPGADSAFERGVKDPKNKQIFLPWSGFQDRDGEEEGELVFDKNEKWAIKIAKKFHPDFASLKKGGKLLMCRNTHQIFGPEKDSERSLFVVCWTKGGVDTRGTGQAIRIANEYGVPVFNLFHESHEYKLRSLITNAIKKEKEAKAK